MANPWEENDPVAGQTAPIAPLTTPPRTSVSPWETNDPVIRSLNSGAPTVEETALAGARIAADRRFQSIGPGRRILAVAREVAGSIPIVRNFSPVSDFANPEFNLPATLDLADYRSGWPGHAGMSRTIGRSVPFTAAARIPALFSSIPRAAGTTGGIEAADAYQRGEPALAAGGRGALASIPASVLGRLITPRSQLGIDRVNRRAVDDYSSLYTWTPEGVRRPPNLNFPTMTPLNIGNPLFQNEILAYLAGNYAGAHPAISLTAGALPSLYAGARTLERRGALLDRINRLSPDAASRAGDLNEVAMQMRPLNRLDALAYRYGQNRFLSPSQHALLNALGTPAVQELIGPEIDSGLQRVSPSTTVTGR